jgi:hypothetical protein
LFAVDGQPGEQVRSLDLVLIIGRLHIQGRALQVWMSLHG